MKALLATRQFKKDIRKIKKNKEDFLKVSKVLEILQSSGISGIPSKLKPHRLKGKYKDNWECHIKPDLLIIWFQIDEENKIVLVRLGSHSQLFK
ncbi:type II toxin-antitoxin system YafQ family toxin [Flagellimonas sp.]|uniref:type II toxin-antitoxin system RelE/ParE family toxin n=1 Tax=Flagellimonas sp. TaxID=2058762 RepID=UPI003BAB329A